MDRTLDEHRPDGAPPMTGTPPVRAGSAARPGPLLRSRRGLFLPGPAPTILAAIVALAGIAGSSSAEPGLTGLVANADGSWESGLRWGPEGVEGPEFGAFAERMPVTGAITAVEVTLGRLDHSGPTSFLLEVFVWADAEGLPGPVVALASFDFVGELPVLPLADVLSVPIEAPILRTPWAGARITSNADGDLVAVAADLDGGAFVAPMTNIAPGLGFPVGWQPVGTVFEPARSLGIAATMTEIAFEGDILESVGGSDEGEAAVGTGVWDFERRTEDEIDAPGCAYDWPDTVGSLDDFDGWVAAGPSLGAGLGPFLGESGEVAIGTESNVEGQVLWFYDPDVLGFPPHHLATYELPMLDDDVLGLNPGFSALSFVAETEPGASPETAGLVWVVGSSVLRADGTWGPWRDLRCPVTVGASSHLVPLLAQGSVRRVRIGMENPGDILIQSRGKGADKVKEVKKTFGPQKGYKAVPVISQSKAKVTCQSAAAAQCLAYWAANGYPEILPEGDTLKQQQEALAKALAKKIERSEDPDDGKEGLGWGGIGSYLKAKGVYTPQQPPGPPPRRPLVSHNIPVDKGAPYDSLKHHLERSHDVILGFKAYRDSSGVQVEVRNDRGEPIAHAVTAAQIVEENGKKTIRVADPNGKATPTVGNVDEAGKAYENMEVIETGPPMKLKCKAMDWPGTQFLCLTSIQIVRPTPGNDPTAGRPVPVLAGGATNARSGLFGEAGSAAVVGAGPVPAARGVFVEDLYRRGGGDPLVTYGYALLNDRLSPMHYFVLQVQVPVVDVEAPTGWNWASLPSVPPDYETCENALGHNGGGVVWWTDIAPVFPGETLSGFRFKADSQYPSDPEAVDWYLATEDDGGEYGFVVGPAPVGDPSHTPEALATLGPDLRAFVLPNPARTVAELHFLAPVAGEARFSIFDAGGRVVRRETIPRVGPGSVSFRWDGRDERGRTMPAGSYFYRVEQVGRRGEGRFVLLE